MKFKEYLNIVFIVPFFRKKYSYKQDCLLVINGYNLNICVIYLCNYLAYKSSML